MRHLELRMFTRWHRYRYSADPAPQAAFRVLNAGIVLPVASIASILTTISALLAFAVYGFTAIPIYHAAGVDTRAVVGLPSAVYYASGCGPFTLMLWAYLAKSERTHKAATALGLVLAALIAPVLYELWPITLTFIAMLWCADGIRLTRGRTPIESRLWRMWVA